tara:strand:+ start:253 stop:741 length:489 start_codon:yes stop_codon:yes gene_type:complete
MYRILVSLFTILLIASCAKYENPLDLKNGNCFINLNANEILENEIEEVFVVEVVDCSEPHNFEVIATFASVPDLYKEYEDPIDQVCLDSLIDYIDRILPSSSSGTLLKVYEKFDQNYRRYHYFNKVDNTFLADNDKNFVCAVMSIDSLIYKTFKQSIETFII